MRHRILSKKQVLTIPNLLSLARLLLIPVICWLYIGEKNYEMAAVMIVVSGATDIIDGWIARKFHMVSDFGKILDPVADKLTQLALILCLASRYPWMELLAMLFIMKEVVLVLFGFASIRLADSVNSSKWYGKATTVVVYMTMMILVLIPDISIKTANLLIGILIMMVLFSLMMYISFYIKFLDQKQQKRKE